VPAGGAGLHESTHSATSAIAAAAGGGNRPYGGGQHESAGGEAGARRRRAEEPGLAAAAASAAAAAAAAEDFTRWGHTSMYLGGRGGEARGDARRSSETVHAPLLAGAQDANLGNMMQGDVEMRALLSLKRAECDGLTREVQLLKGNQSMQSSLVSQQIADLRAALQLPLHRQALEERLADAICNGNVCWAHQACVVIEFLFGLLLDTGTARSVRASSADAQMVAKLEAQVLRLQQDLSTLQNAHETLQVPALLAHTSCLRSALRCIFVGAASRQTLIFGEMCACLSASACVCARARARVCSCVSV